MKKMLFVTMCMVGLVIGTTSSLADITSDLAFYASFDNGDLVADVNTHADWAKTPQLTTGASSSAASKLGAGSMYVTDFGTNGAIWRVGTFYSTGTISFWFKPDGWELANGTRRSLASITQGSDATNQNGIQIASGQYDALESRRYLNWTGSSIGSADPSGGLGSDWTYITVVWSNSVVSKLYVNGSDTGISGNNQMLSQGTEQMVIGNMKASGLAFGNESGGGWYDEVKLYSRALSDADVAELYAVPEPATIGLMLMGIVGLMRRR